jgi:putative redox protein
MFDRPTPGPRLFFFPMPTIQTRYTGDLRTESTHMQSGTVILTDAPTDNQGRGEAFSPTDLLANALGTCIVTTMAIVARRDGIDLTGSHLAMTKIMTSQPPRRVARIEIELTVVTPAPLPPDVQDRLGRIAHTCPVALSLHPDVEQVVNIHWETSQ